MTHKIKLQKQFCDAVLEKKKTFEIRKNDRGYQTGDIVIFDPVENSWPYLQISHPIEKKTYKITYLLSGFGLKEDYVVFSIREVYKDE